MHATDVIRHYTESIRFMDSLRHLNEEEWRRPLAPGKWTVAEVAGHFASWDYFILTERLPCIFGSSPLPKGPDAAKLNASSAYKSRIRNKNETIHDFIESRHSLIHALSALPSDEWSRKFRVGGTPMTLEHYFGGMIEHDLRHFQEIRQVLQID